MTEIQRKAINKALSKGLNPELANDFIKMVHEFNEVMEEITLPHAGKRPTKEIDALILCSLEAAHDLHIDTVRAVKSMTTEEMLRFLFDPTEEN